jgi:hypothetical protein
VAERWIELGELRIHLREDEEAVTLLQSLMRHVSNQEIATMLGISERTVRRWKRAGQLPRPEHARLKLADLLGHLSRSLAGSGTPGASPLRDEARRQLSGLLDRLVEGVGAAPLAEDRPT